ncbi:MAG: CsgG/HfaB family protein [Elusimicrobiota bacterium]
MRKIVLIIGLLFFGASFSFADTYNYLAKKISKSAKQLTNKKIAILPFQYYDGRRSPGSTIVAEYLTTKIVERGKLQVVERTLLNKIMDEMKLGKSGIIDQETTKELGKILGVDAIVTGVLIEESERRNSKKTKKVDINTRVIKIETGDILVAVSKKIKKTWKDEPYTETEQPSISGTPEEKPQQLPVEEIEHGMSSPQPSESEIIEIGPRARARAGSEIEGDSAVSIPPQLKQSYRSLKERRYKDAINEAKNVFHNNQNKPLIAAHALFIIGRASESEGDIRRARESYIRIIKDYPFSKNIVQRAQQRVQHFNQMRRR